MKHWGFWVFVTSYWWKCRFLDNGGGKLRDWFRISQPSLSENGEMRRSSMGRFCARDELGWCGQKWAFHLWRAWHVDLMNTRRAFIKDMQISSNRNGFWNMLYQRNWIQKRVFYWYDVYQQNIGGLTSQNSKISELLWPGPGDSSIAERFWKTLKPCPWSLDIPGHQGRSSVNKPPWSWVILVAVGWWCHGSGEDGLKHRTRIAIGSANPSGEIAPVPGAMYVSAVGSPVPNNHPVNGNFRILKWRYCTI
jgi:hypothetical protein